jgi:hypothetical protein
MSNTSKTPLKCGEVIKEAGKPERYGINMAEGVDQNRIPYRAENIPSNEELKPEKRLGYMELVACICEKFTFFDVQGSAHRECIVKYNQQDATLHNSFISAKCSTCFRRFLRPSSGAQIYTYSIWCLLNCNDKFKQLLVNTFQ